MHGVASTAGKRKSVHNISSHKRFGLIIFPPAPTAVVVLVAVKSIQTALNLCREIIRRANRSGLHVLQRLSDDDVGQEARHRLLGAAVRITSQVIERAEQRARY